MNFGFGPTGFDEAFPQSPPASGKPVQIAPLRRKKTLTQNLTFWGGNLLLTPLVCVVYVTVIAEGLRQLMAVFATRIHRLPLPGAKSLREFQGWSEVDLAVVMSVLIFVVVSFVWIRIFKVLIAWSDLADQGRRNPLLYGVLGFIALTILVTDILLFYWGLASKASSGWSDSPGFVAAAASVAYLASLALWGWWHADYHASGKV